MCAYGTDDFTRRYDLPCTPPAMLDQPAPGDTWRRTCRAAPTREDRTLRS
jgi:hypothetical protein